MKRVCGGAVENALGHLKTGHHQPLSATDSRMLLDKHKVWN